MPRTCAESKQCPYCCADRLVVSLLGKEVAEDQQALGGAVAFGTGIAEVELPIDYQLDNIEQTELAKAEFIKRQNNRKFNHRNDLDEMDSHGTGGNFGSNFRQHNRCALSC